MCSAGPDERVSRASGAGLNFLALSQDEACGPLTSQDEACGPLTSNLPPGLARHRTPVTLASQPAKCAFVIGVGGPRGWPGGPTGAMGVAVREGVSRTSLGGAAVVDTKLEVVVIPAARA